MSLIDPATEAEIHIQIRYKIINVAFNDIAFGLFPIKYQSVKTNNNGIIFKTLLIIIIFVVINLFQANSFILVGNIKYRFIINTFADIQIQHLEITIIRLKFPSSVFHYA